MVGTRSIVACTLRREWSQEHRPGIHHAVGHLLVVGSLYDEVLRRIGIGHPQGRLPIGHHYQLALFQCLSGNLLAGQQLQLTFHLLLHRLHQTERGGYQHGLTVRPVFGLAQQVGCHKHGIGRVVGQHLHFRGTCRHVDGYIAQAHQLLGSRDILIARAENLIHLGNALRPVCHGCDGLYPSGLEDTAHAGLFGGKQHGGVYTSVASRRRTKHHLTTAGDAGGHRQHQ